MNARERIAAAIVARRQREGTAPLPVVVSLAERLTRETQAKRYTRKHGAIRHWIDTPSGSWSVATYRDGTAKVFPR